MCGIIAASLCASCARALLEILWFRFVSKEWVFSSLGISQKSSIFVWWVVPSWIIFDLANGYWILRHDLSFQRALFDANLMGGFVYVVFNCSMMSLLETWTPSFALVNIAFSMLSNVLLVALQFYLRSFL